MSFANAKICKIPKGADFQQKKLQEFETVTLTKDCSAFIFNKLPLKRKHPRNLTILYSVGNLKFQKVLCDSGALINLMPLSIYRKLGLGEAKPINI